MPMYGPLSEEQQKELEAYLMQKRGGLLGDTAAPELSPTSELDSIVPRKQRPVDPYAAYDKRIEEATNAGPNLGQVIGAGMAGFGQAMTYGKDRYLDRTLEGIDDNRKRNLLQAQTGKTLFEEGDERNPESPTSKEFQTLAAELTGRTPEDVAGLSAFEIKKVLPSLEKRYNLKLKSDERADRSKYLDEIAKQRAYDAEQQRQLQRELAAGRTPKETEEQKQMSRLKVKKIAAKPKEKALLSNAESNFDRMIKEAEDIKNHSGLSGATGLNRIAGAIPGTPAYNALTRINTLKSKTGFSVLQDMRANSPTGGALGQVSDRENTMLQENISSLDPKQSTEDFKASLDRVIDYAKGAKQRLRQAYEEHYADMPDSAEEGMPTGESEVAATPEARSDGRIKVSNGAETLYILPEDEAEAAQDGYKRVP